MSYEVRLGRKAEAYLRRLPSVTRQRILPRIDQIGAEPYGMHTKPPTNAAGLRSARVGGFRVVFEVND